MPRRVGPPKVRRCSLEFKLKAVKLGQLKGGVEVQAVAGCPGDSSLHAVAVAEGGARQGFAGAGWGYRRR
jgi:hypothetical protein